jgi:hypothetical protein
VLNAGGYGLRPRTAAGIAGAPRERAQSVGGGGGGGGGSGGAGRGLHTRMEGGVWITSRGPHPAGGPLQLQPQGAMQRMLGNAAITGQATAGAGMWLPCDGRLDRRNQCACLHAVCSASAALSRFYSIREWVQVCAHLFKTLSRSCQTIWLQRRLGWRVGDGRALSGLAALTLRVPEALRSSVLED